MCVCDCVDGCGHCVFVVLPGFSGGGPQYVHSTVGLFPGKFYIAGFPHGISMNTFIISPIGFLHRVPSS